MNNEFEIKKGMIIKGAIVLAIVITGFILNPIVIIGAGDAGVVISKITGVKKEYLNEGMHFIVPTVDNVEVYDVKVQKYERDSKCSTSDLQDVDVKLAINYKIDQQKLTLLHQEVGVDYLVKIIHPAMEEAIKAAAAKFKIEEMITKRSELRELALSNLAEKLSKYYIILETVNIVNIKFSDAYANSVEKKQIASENVKTAAFNVAEEMEKTRRKKVEAEGKKYMARSIDDRILKLEWIKKWDGKLPTYSGNGGNLMNIPIK